MDRELLTDIILLSLNSIGTSLFNFYPAVYVFMCSYHHFFNPLINFKIYYFTVLIRNIGIAFGSWISSPFYDFLGVKIGLIMSAVINLLFLWLHVYFQGTLVILGSYFLYGVFYQLVSNGNNLFIAEKYANGISYSKYFSSTRLVFIVFLGFFFQWVVNPDGNPPDVLDDNGFLYYNHEILK